METQGLTLEAVAAERIADRRRAAAARRRARRPRRPAGSWVLAGSLPTWLGR